MLFIVFDIEIVFLYPLALRMHQLKTFGLAEMVDVRGAAGGGVRVRVEAGCPGVAVRPVHVQGAVRPDDLEQYVMLTTLEKALAWGQSNSIWPAGFGLACCAIEMMSLPSPRYDIARFGSEVFRSSPRQADLMIVSGRCRTRCRRPCARSTTRCCCPSG